MQVSTNVVMVKPQPTAAVMTTVIQTGSGDYMFSIVMTVLCCICGGWWNLCTAAVIMNCGEGGGLEARGIDLSEYFIYKLGMA